MLDQDSPEGAGPQGGGRIISFPTPPGANPRARRLRVLADAYRLAAESIEIQLRAEAHGEVVGDLAAQADELVGRARRLST